jgi:acetyltransferase-like isoleucine patch superfamily enzyme
MTEKEKMICGNIYHALDPELRELSTNARILTHQYNATMPNEDEKRISILKKLLASCTDNTFIEPDFKCDYGFNIHVTGFLLMNFNCVLLDVCKITIGDNVFIGPNTCITTASHPLLPQERLQSSFGKPVSIGSDVWIGANCTILPGVTIGDGTVIGAGSVVTKSIPSNVIAVGNPCKALRPITEKDSVKNFASDKKEFSPWKER